MSLLAAGPTPPKIDFQGDLRALIPGSLEVHTDPEHLIGRWTQSPAQSCSHWSPPRWVPSELKSGGPGSTLYSYSQQTHFLGEHRLKQWPSYRDLSLFNILLRVCTSSRVEMSNETQICLREEDRATDLGHPAAEASQEDRSDHSAPWPHLGLRLINNSSKR